MANYKKIITRTAIAIAVIIGALVYMESRHVDPNIPRPVFKIKKDALYNGAYLIKIYRPSALTYFPNNQQMIDNIPKCMAPTKHQAKEVLEAYNTIYKHLRGEYSAFHSNLKIGILSKTILNYIYNYNYFPYYKSLYDEQLMGVRISQFIGGNIGFYHLNMKSIADSIYTHKQQVHLAYMMNQAYTQASNNCIQSGFGQDFYAVWWAGQTYFSFYSWESEQSGILATVAAYLTYPKFSTQAKKIISNPYVQKIKIFLDKTKFKMIDLKDKTYARLFGLDIMHQITNNQMLESSFENAFHYIPWKKTEVPFNVDYYNYLKKQYHDKYFFQLVELRHDLFYERKYNKPLALKILKHYKQNNLIDKMTKLRDMYGLINIATTYGGLKMNKLAQHFLELSNKYYSIKGLVKHKN